MALFVVVINPERKIIIDGSLLRMSTGLEGSIALARLLAI